MKKTIALESALLLSSSLFVGCGANNAGPQTQGNQQGAGKQQAQTQAGCKAGKMTTKRDQQNANVLNMRAYRNLEASVNQALGTKGTKVYISTNSAYVRLDPSLTAGNRAGTMGANNNRAGTTGTGTFRSGQTNNLGATGTGTGDRTAIDGTGGGLFGNRGNNGGGLFGMGDNNRGGLFGGGTGTAGTGTGGGLFGTGLGNTTHNDTAGITRSNTLNNGAGGGAGLFNRGTTGYGTTAGDYTGYGAANGGRTDMYGTGTGTTAGRSRTFGTGAANHSAIGGGAGLDTTTRTRVTQAIQKANPQIRDVYFITK